MLCQDDGAPLTRPFVQAKMKRASRRVGMPHDGLHILRHSFCSHLAMRGAPARAIQELAGHADLTMTQRYMHLSPAALEAAIGQGLRDSCHGISDPAMSCVRSHVTRPGG